ncbi:MAG: hypothetical protein KGZ64_06045 [Thermaerobacter sp.]|nr:hypothetical protein [Thermaerobacter sp.]
MQFAENRKSLIWREVATILVATIALSAMHFVVWEQTYAGFVVGYGIFLLAVLSGQILCMYIRRGVIHLATYARHSRWANSVFIFVAALMFITGVTMTITVPLVLVGVVIAALTLVAFGLVYLRCSLRQALYAVYIGAIVPQWSFYFGVSALLVAGFMTGIIDIDNYTASAFGNALAEVIIYSSPAYLYVRMITDVGEGSSFFSRAGSNCT